MKFLRKIFDKQKPHFHKGGKYENLQPAFEAFETLMFVPNHTTPNKGSQIRDAVDMKRMMMTVIIAMVPCLLFGIWNVGHQHFLATGEVGTLIQKVIIGLWIVLPVVVVSYSVGLGIEFIFAIRRGHSVNEGFLVSGMLIPLILPPTIPLWQVAIATAFAVLIGKEVFGGTGMNILNVAMTARAFLYFAYPGDMAGDYKVWTYLDDSKKTEIVDSYSGATALGLAAETSKKLEDKIISVRSALIKVEVEKKEKELASTGKVDLQALSDYKKEILKTIDNKAEIIALKKDVPFAVNKAFKEESDKGLFSAKSMFLGTIPGSIGETSTLMCLIGAFILIFTGVGSWKIVASAFGGAYLMALFFQLTSFNAFMAMPAYYHLLLGGMAFGIVFMATDPVTAAQTETGKWFYGLLIGVLTVLIRVFNPAYPEGIMLAVLLMNVMAPTIDYFVVDASKKRRLKRAELKHA